MHAFCSLNPQEWMIELHLFLFSNIQYYLGWWLISLDSVMDLFNRRDTTLSCRISQFILFNNIQYSIQFNYLAFIRWICSLTIIVWGWWLISLFMFYCSTYLIQLSGSQLLIFHHYCFNVVDLSWRFIGVSVVCNITLLHRSTNISTLQRICTFVWVI